MTEHTEKKKNWFVRHKIITGIIVLIIIGLLAGGGSQPAKDTGAKTEAKTETKQENAKIGQAVRDGKFEFTVKKITCGQSQVGTNQYLTKKAQGQYCLLDITVKNIGNEAQDLFSANQYLYNKAGQKYTADDTATMYAAPDSTNTWYSSINPGNSVEGQIVFDIPKDQTPVTAELHDSSLSGGIKVSL